MKLLIAVLVVTGLLELH